jgi:hypothetical protein
MTVGRGNRAVSCFAAVRAAAGGEGQQHGQRQEQGEEFIDIPLHLVPSHSCLGVGTGYFPGKFFDRKKESPCRQRDRNGSFSLDKHSVIDIETDVNKVFVTNTQETEWSVECRVWRY